MSDGHGLAGVVGGNGKWVSVSSLWTGDSFERAGRRLGAELLSGSLSPKAAASTWSPNAEVIGGELGGSLAQTPFWAAAAASRRREAPRQLTGSGGWP